MFAATLINTIAPMDDAPTDIANVVAGQLILVVSAAAVIRSFWWGIRIRDGQMTAHPWVRTSTFPITAITSVNVVPYSGLLNDGNLDYTGQWIKAICIERDGRPPLVVRGCLAPRRRALEQVAVIRQAVGLAPLPERPQTPRHRRAVK